VTVLSSRTERPEVKSPLESTEPQTSRSVEG
jgi:hypothetical protein